MTNFEVVVADIAEAQADAIVNAANEQLAEGGGVCGAIFEKAGPGLAQEIAANFEDGCPTGQAVATLAYKLKANYIIHAVAPIHIPGSTYLSDFGQNELLENAYKSVIREAWRTGSKTIAIPSLGTGIYGWDVLDATPLARNGILAGLRETPQIQKITFVCFTEEVAEVYRDLFKVELEYGFTYGQICPRCGMKAVPIAYGLLAGPPEDDAVIGGCTISPGQPNWACKSCSLQFA